MVDLSIRPIATLAKLASDYLDESPEAYTERQIRRLLQAAKDCRDHPVLQREILSITVSWMLMLQALEDQGESSTEKLPIVTLDRFVS